MDGKVCVVAGVGPGNGAALSRRFAAGGYRVAMLARSRDRLEKLQAELPESRGYALDITERDAVARTFARIRQKLGPVDVLVHNAAAGAFNSFMDLAPETLELTFRTNTMSLLHCGQQAAAQMLERGRGAIIVTGNTSAWRGMPNFAGFAPTKAAQRILAQSMARSLGPQGIHVAYVIIDAVIDLPWTRQRFADRPDDFFIQPDAIADTVWHLAHQKRSAWTFELDLRPFGEKWWDMRAPADAIEEIRGWIAQSERIVVLTGAGISTDSGIPDFRGPQGVWTKNPEAEKMATLSHYMSDPEIRKRAWRSRMDSFERQRQPNPGHLALVELERRGKLDTLITQNVDGLHLAAGSSPERVVEIHGTMREVNCMSCGERAPMERALARVRAGEDDPPCRTCGGILKSATISFGQGLVEKDLQRADDAARRCDLMLAVGSTLSVYPIAAVVPIAKEASARVVIVNAEPTEMDRLADAVVRGSISEVLPAICGA